MERDPSTRATLGFVKVHEQFVVMGALERQAAVCVGLRFDNADRLGRSFVTARPRVSQVLDRAPDPLRVRPELAGFLTGFETQPGLGVPVSLIASLPQLPTTADEIAHSFAGLIAGCSSTTADPPGRQHMRQLTS